MTSIPFDSHEFYSELVQSGLAEKTADALTKAVVKIEKAKLDDIATKRDLKELENSLRHDLELKIEKSKTETIKWIASIVIGAGVAQIFAIMGLLKLLGKI